MLKKALEHFIVKSQFLNHILGETSYKMYEVFLLDRNSQDQVIKVNFLPEEKIHLIK